MTDTSTEKENIESNENKRNKGNSHGDFWRYTVVLFVFLVIFFYFFEINLTIKPRSFNNTSGNDTVSQGRTDGELISSVLPKDGVVLPIKWGNIGKKMVDAGVIDSDKFSKAMGKSIDQLSNEEKELLLGSKNESIRMTQENSRFILNLLWAFGLANKNPILEKGPMQDPKYGGAERFASTGGWTVSKENAMNYFSKYELAILDDRQQAIVERVSKKIYRPCCGNATYFPDCNHGMAMLGLLELMAANGASEQEMYSTALKVNSLWFPETYVTIAKYFEKKGVKWDNVNAEEILGSAYSSASGYRQIAQEVNPPKIQGNGGGCGV